MSEKNPLDRPSEGPSSASSSDRLVDADRATPRTIAMRDLLGPILMRSVYVGVFVPLLFAYLGSSNVLAPFVGQARSLVSRLAPIWPVLPAQYQRVLEIDGPGHAASYGFMCAALWVWPVICAVASLREHVRRRSEMLPISGQEIGGVIVIFPFAVLALVFDMTKDASPLFGFHVDRWGFFYLRQWLFFSLIAFVLTALIYLVGRIVLERIWRRA